MPTQHAQVVSLLKTFRNMFTAPTFERITILTIGAILTSGTRTVASILRTLGMAKLASFANYHHVLSRNRWSALEGARLLLWMLVATFCPQGTVVLGMDETLERRIGPRIAKKGVFHDPARSSQSVRVQASGLRWVVMMLLTPIQWAGRTWALPFLSLLAPPRRYYEQRASKGKRLVDWARQGIDLISRWLPQRRLVFVGDANYATHDLIGHCQALPGDITLIGRMRLNARLHDLPRPSGGTGRGRPAKKGPRLPSLAEMAGAPDTQWTVLPVSNWYGRGPRFLRVASGLALWNNGRTDPVPIRWVLIRDLNSDTPAQALVCSDLAQEPRQILTWFLQRWQVEVTFQEVRTHLGMETQRQWSDLAIERTTPCLMALFSLVTLLAQEAMSSEQPHPQTTAWYHKQAFTFSDALATIRGRLWAERLFHPGPKHKKGEKIETLLLDKLRYTLCYNA